MIADDSNRIVQGETVIGEICHIAAAKPNGPRYDANQTAVARHGYDNLILLCTIHHTVIDDDPEAYTVARLEKMKADHEQLASAITDAEAASGAQLLLSVNQSGGIAAHTIHTINIHPPATPATPSVAAPPVSAGMTFFEPGEVLASPGLPGEQEFTFNAERFVYLRLIPEETQPRVGPVRILEVFKAQKPCPMTNALNGISERNKYGAIIYDRATSHTIAGFTQGFSSGALWGMNGTLFVPLAHQTFPTQPAGETYVIPVVAMEQLYVRVLTNYALVAARELHLDLPYTIELGAKGLKDVYLGVPQVPAGRFEGPIWDDAFRRTYSLAETSDEAIGDLLRRYFNDFYELAGCSRANVLSDAFVAAHNLPPR